MRKTLLISMAVLGLALGPVVSVASEEPEGQSTTTFHHDSGDGDSPILIQTRLLFDSFQNHTLAYSGVSYSLGLSMLSLGSFELYGEVPYLWGESRDVAVQEIGNPKIGFDANIFNGQSLEMWLRTWTTVSQPSGKLASRFDTYRGGLEFRYRHARFFGSLGGGYRVRANEQDHDVDIGNVSDADLTVGYLFGRSWSFQVGLQAFHSEGVKVKDLVYARPADWGGVSPGVRYHLGAGFDLLTEVSFPVLHSRDEQETEVAFWDMSFPQYSQPTLRTQVGARF